MNILNLFHISYYFDSFVNPDFGWLWPLTIVWAVLLIVAIVLQLKFRRQFKSWSGDRKFWWTHWSNMAYTVSITGLFFLFLRYENIPYLNWRLWPSLLTLGVIYWLGYLWYYRRKVQPQKRVDREARKTIAYYFRRRRK